MLLCLSAISLKFYCLTNIVFHCGIDKNACYNNGITKHYCAMGIRSVIVIYAKSTPNTISCCREVEFIKNALKTVASKPITLVCKDNTSVAQII